MTITFHGGEPLIFKEDILSIAQEFVGDKRLRFDIQTNGLLLDSDFIERARACDIRIGFSLDGPPEVSNITRSTKHGNAAELTLRAIEMYKSRHDGEFGVLCTVHRHNVEVLPEMIAYFHSLGATSLFLNPVVPPCDSAAGLVPPMEAMLVKYKEAIRKQIEINRSSPARRRIIMNNVEAMLLNIVADSQPCVCFNSPCGAARYMLVVDWQGDVYPCSQFIRSKEYAIGNLTKHSINEVLEADFSRLVRLRSVETIDECRECVYRAICCANCMFGSLAATGDLFGRPLYCRLWFGLSEFLFELLDEYRDELIPLMVGEENMKMLKRRRRFYDLAGNEHGKADDDHPGLS